MQSGSSRWVRCWDWQSLKHGAGGVSGLIFILEKLMARPYEFP